MERVGASVRIRRFGLCLVCDARGAPNPLGNCCLQLHEDARQKWGRVERRRRDKINNWIVQLSKILPDSVTENSKTGQSKGGILSKACDYIQELRQTQQQLVDNIKETERLHMDNELLRQQVEELRNKNTMLRAHLQQNGIAVMVSSPGQ
ncbi:upstream stimulatory factor 2-like [Lethenteron reissneri]|uniref:upstream stimulatory factor 2-like n=1 Tax=Lethenteron reissneri TaxID=7753 RepID=UPI002AB6BD65|nr:upstream stimulatory factor 2-like [Lethenteron reissneri]